MILTFISTFNSLFHPFLNLILEYCNSLCFLSLSPAGFIVPCLLFYHVISLYRNFHYVPNIYEIKCKFLSPLCKASQSGFNFPIFLNFSSFTLKVSCFLSSLPIYLKICAFLFLCLHISQPVCSQWHLHVFTACLKLTLFWACFPWLSPQLTLSSSLELWTHSLSYVCFITYIFITYTLIFVNAYLKICKHANIERATTMPYTFWYTKYLGSLFTNQILS